MQDGVRKSCWGVTLWTVMAFSGLLALGLLSDLPERSVTIANDPSQIADAN